jgi:D-tyrosyl-tRNA(Tyr) deacylase
LIGVEETDTKEDAGYLAEKVVNLRVFEDNDGKMNLSLMDIKGEMLAVSQFTLMGDCRKGRRPSFTQAANPEKAIELYNCFIEKCKQIGIKVETGVFQAEMKVRLCNEGPVTLIIDSNKLF